MGSTNFLLFNPTQANQETDAEYLTDATRTGGAGVDALWLSPSANKTLYQLTCGMYAIMEMMAGKGFTTLDTDPATLTAVLANILTTVDIPGGLQSVAWSPTISLNATKYSGFQIALAGALSFTISGQTAGQIICLLWVQDGTGGWTVTFPGNVNGGAQSDPTPNVLSAQLFKVDAAGNLDAVGPVLSVNGMGGVAIGSFNPAPGNFSTLQVAGAAPDGQVLTGNGVSYVPVAAPGYTSGSNANGYWQKDPSGLIRQWGNNFNAPGHLIFPTPFTNAASVSVMHIQQFVNGGTARICFLNDNSGGDQVSTTGCYLNVSNSAAIQVNWKAVGY